MIIVTKIKFRKIKMYEKIINLLNVSIRNFNLFSNFYKYYHKKKIKNNTIKIYV